MTGGNNDANNMIKEVEHSVEGMAAQGLRTLLYGMKEIQWDGSRDPLDLMEDEIECDLTLLAATGVEDLLQERVKECIEDFRDAGIAVWMLTGDKGLTALEIGTSCGLIPKNRQDMRGDDNGVIMATEQNVVETEQNLAEGSSEGACKVLVFEDTDTNATLLLDKIKLFLKQVEKEPKYCVSISGMVIAVALDNEFTHPQLG